jgi:hypothetical protein
MSEKQAKAERQAQKPILKRLLDIEADLTGLVDALNKSLTLVEQRLTTLDEVSNAVVSVLGVELVQAAITASHVKKAKADADAQAKALLMAVDKGLVIKSELLTEKSVIVGRELDKDGNEVPPGRVQMLYGQIKEEFRAALLGKPVGTQIDTPVGGKFEVVDLYEIQEKPVPPAEAKAKTEEEEKAAQDAAEARVAEAVAAVASSEPTVEILPDSSDQVDAELLADLENDTAKVA